VTVTSALGIAPPLGSVTWPLMAEDCCANSDAGSMKTTQASAKNNLAMERIVVGVRAKP
jgi:hypothetical protein